MSCRRSDSTSATGSTPAAMRVTEFIPNPDEY
jgi:hypothetical protein